MIQALVSLATSIQALTWLLMLMGITLVVILLWRV